VFTKRFVPVIIIAIVFALMAPAMCFAGGGQPIVGGPYRVVSFAEYAYKAPADYYALYRGYYFGKSNGMIDLAYEVNGQLVPLIIAEKDIKFIKDKKFANEPQITVRKVRRGYKATVRLAPRDYRFAPPITSPQG
jgi:hypothetical protein